MNHVREREYNNNQRTVAVVMYLQANKGRRLTEEQIRDHFGIDRNTLRRLLLDIEYVIGHLVIVQQGYVLYVDHKDRPGL
jgi:hypothetical protein